MPLAQNLLFAATCGIATIAAARALHSAAYANGYAQAVTDLEQEAKVALLRGQVIGLMARHPIDEG